MKNILLYVASLAICLNAAAFSVCAVGDSITQGGGTKFVSHRVALESRFNELGWNVEWKGTRYDSSSANPCEGYSSRNAEYIAEQYEAHAAEVAADVLLLHAGHNYNGGDPDLTPAVMTVEDILAAATGAHRRIIAAARERNPDVIVLYAQVITSGGNREVKYSYIPALNDAIAELAEELNTEESPVIAVDMAEGWNYATDCVSDCVHPNATGAAKMAAKWMTALGALASAGRVAVVGEEVKDSGNELLSSVGSPVVESCLVEAESFAAKGGWVVDPQFVEQMGSPYLLAHGKGVPVADAKTSVNIRPGHVHAYVRTRDWTPDWDGEKPGRFELSLGGKAFPNTLGVAPAKWGWVDAGVVEVGKGPQVLALHDLTGFEGRCDAIYLCPEGAVMPPNDATALAAWRAKMLGEAGAPEDVLKADFVIVGGGIAGTAAAIAAADAGLSVALVQDRPVLGGNASDEIRVQCGKKGYEGHWIVKEIMNASRDNGHDATKYDKKRMALANSYANLSLHLGWRAYGVVTNAERRIVAVDARNVETGARRRFIAPLFCDATGDGWIAYWAGAKYMLGREAKDEYDEPQCGQDAADTSTMGNSLLWTTKEQAGDYAFPEVPWATKVSGKRAALGGNWQWEAGLGPDEDTIDDAEMLRDRMFRAIYGCFSTAKRNPKNARRVFDWVPYIAGKRESRRIIGDYVVSEKDVTEQRPFEDAIGISAWTIDLHWKKNDYITSTTHVKVKPWWMPYRSLCCRDVPNLFLAGSCASYTHVAFGSSRVMNAIGQQGVAVGYAASLCKKYGCLPHAIHEDAAKTAELQRRMNDGQAAHSMKPCDWPGKKPSEAEGLSVIVDNADAKGVEISGAWKASDSNADRYGADYLHNAKAASEDLWVRFTPEIPSNAVYSVSLFWNGDRSRASAVPVEIVYDGGTVTNHVNMTKNSGTWNKIGEWPFAAGSSGSVRILTVGKRGKTVIADAVKFVLQD